MRTAVAATALGITLIAAAGLGGCAPHNPVRPPPDPVPSRAPVFASDEEALAAAEALYGAYESATDAIGQAGWTELEPLGEYLRGDALDDETTSSSELAAKGLHQAGASKFYFLTLQQLNDGGDGQMEMVVYVCGDVTDVDVLDPDGNSVVASSRPNKQALEVTIDDFDGDLRISGRDAWSGKSFC